MTPIKLRAIDVSKVHWKAQAYAHFILSIPIAVLTVHSWGIPVAALVRLVLAYLAEYLFIYVPLYAVLPYTFLGLVKKQLKKINNGEELNEADQNRLINFLLNSPLPIALVTVIIEISAFCLGAYVWTTGIVVPELLPIINLALLETFILGLVVAINVAVLNLVLIETFFGSIAEQLVSMYPELHERKLPIKRISIYTKIFFLVLLSTLAGEVSILIFFITYILSSNPEQFYRGLFYICAVILINIGYLFVLAPLAAGNFVKPIKKLVVWVKSVSKGNLESRINYLTNDETADIIQGSNIMVYKLGRTSDELNKSLSELEIEHQLVESEKNKLEVILNGIGDGVIALDENYRLLLINPAAEQISGCKQKEVVGKHIDEVFKLEDEQNQVVKAVDYFGSLTLDQPISHKYSNSILKLTISGNESKFINLTCSGINHLLNLEKTYILTFQDMSQRQQLEEMKIDFVSMAAHELRTPLTSIKGYLSLFLQQHKQSLSESQFQMLEKVFFASQQLGVLIESLLSISKIEQGKMVLNYQDVDWKQLIEEHIDLVIPVAMQKKIKMQALFPVELQNYTVSCDKIRLQEVLNNLISNAIKYTRENGEVWVKVEEKGESMVTHIIDTGIGIPQSAIPNMFTKFFRVTSSLFVAGSKGTGLGLYISKAIVDAHGGEIGVVSEDGKGSDFWFRIPRVKVDESKVIPVE